MSESNSDVGLPTALEVALERSLRDAEAGRVMDVELAFLKLREALASTGPSWSPQDDSGNFGP